MKLMVENIKIALQSILTNLLRTVLTIFIIAIGIAALVGISEQMGIDIVMLFKKSVDTPKFL